MPKKPTRPVRAPVLLVFALLALACGLAACGDGDDDGASRSSTVAASPPSGTEREPSPDQADRQSGRRDADRPSKKGGGGAASPDPQAAGDPGEAAAKPPSDEAGAQVAAVVTGMYRDFAAADAAGVCRAMSKDARDQIAQQVIGGSTAPPGQRTCVASFSKFLDAAARSGMLEGALSAQVKSVDVNGTTAVATVVIGGKSGEIGLLREDGAWRFGSFPQSSAQ